MINFIIWFGWSIFTMGMAERLIHQHIMHKRFFPRGIKFIDDIFEKHAIEHHRKERYDINIDLPLYYHLIVGGPLLILLYIYSWPAFIAFSLICIYHSYFWSKLHRSTHDLESNWTERLPWYKSMREHHLRHHEHTNKNFNVVFPMFDKLFGTKI